MFGDGLRRQARNLRGICHQKRTLEETLYWVM